MCSMKNTIIALIILFYVVATYNTSYGDSFIDATNASSHLGEVTTVCGKVAQVSHIDKGVILNLTYPYPNQDFSFIIWNSDLPKFSSQYGNLDMLLHRELCGRGEIKLYKRQYEIILYEPSTLKIIKFTEE